MHHLLHLLRDESLPEVIVDCVIETISNFLTHTVLHEDDLSVRGCKTDRISRGRVPD
jgi:hypothetical protein